MVFSLPLYSIYSFQTLTNAFIQKFQNNIGPQISLTNLMHCKHNIKEKIADFIGRFKHLYARISYLVSDHDIQRIIIF
jgi:hypothetical protein